MKIKKVYTKKRHIVSSAEMKKFFGIEKKDKIITFGLWAGRSPKMEEDGVDADVDTWYIETNDMEDELD